MFGFVHSDIHEWVGPKLLRVFMSADMCIEYLLVDIWLASFGKSVLFRLPEVGVATLAKNFRPAEG